MPFMKSLTVDPDLVLDRSQAATPHHLLQSVLLNPDFVEPVQVALDEDGKFGPLYQEFERTGKVPELAGENEGYSTVRDRLSAGFLPTEEEEEEKGGKEEGYEDAQVKVSTKHRTLTVKHWLLAHPTLTIELDKLIFLRPARDVIANGGVSSWGVGLGGVGWARDGDRTSSKLDSEACKHSWVAMFTEWGEECCAGFTVTDPVRFVGVVERLRPGVTKGRLDDEVPEI